MYRVCEICHVKYAVAVDGCKNIILQGFQINVDPCGSSFSCSHCKNHGGCPSDGIAACKNTAPRSCTGGFIDDQTAALIDGKPVGGKAPELIDILQKYLVKEFIDATTV